MEPRQNTDQQEIQAPEITRGWLLSMLLENKVSMYKYVLRAGLISFVPSIMLVGVLAASGVMRDEGAPSFEGNPFLLVSLLVLIGPLIETFLMAPVLWVLSFITRRVIPLAAMSACLWAGMHSLSWPTWGLGVIWPFFVFSCSYLTWRRRSFWHAILVTSCVHGLQNLIPGIIMVATQ